MNKYLFIAIISMISISAYSQGFYEIEEHFKLFNSGKKKVSIYKDSALISFKTIDSTKRIITENSIQSSANIQDSPAPKYDKLHSIKSSKISFYNSDGKIDSMLLIHYKATMQGFNGEVFPAKADSTLLVFRHTLLREQILTRNFYSINKGTRVLYRTDHYGYNNNDQLIILIEDDGHHQFTFEYNAQGMISAYYVHKAKVSFEYDEFGRKARDVYKTSKNTYLYDQNSLLVKKITTGMHAGVFTYEYE